MVQLNYVPGVPGVVVHKPPIKLRIKKALHNYVMTYISDYRAVAIETVQKARAKPIRTAVILNIANLAYYFYRSRPSWRHYEDVMMENREKLMVLGIEEKSPKAHQYVRNSSILLAQDRLKHHDFLFVTAVTHEPASSSVDAYAAHAAPLYRQSWFFNFPERIRKFMNRIVDIGWAGEWLHATDAMIDYDVFPKNTQPSHANIPLDPKHAPQ